MPAPTRYPTPAQQLLVLAEEARAAGRDFGEFWAHAVERQPLVRVGTPNPPEGVVIWPRDRSDRRIFYAAVISTRAAWRRAYYGEPPTRAEAALVIIAPVLARIERTDELPDLIAA